MASTARLRKFCVCKIHAASARSKMHWQAHGCPSYPDSTAETAQHICPALNLRARHRQRTEYCVSQSNRGQTQKSIPVDAGLKE